MDGAGALGSLPVIPPVRPASPQRFRNLLYEAWQSLVSAWTLISVFTRIPPVISRASQNKGTTEAETTGNGGEGSPLPTVFFRLQLRRY